MPGLKAGNPFPRLASALLDEHALAVAWAPGGDWLAALPSEGRPALLRPGTDAVTLLEPHRGGNGALAWHPDRDLLATYGHDRVIRLYEPPFTEPARQISVPERGWAERLAWNRDGTLLAAAAGRAVCVLDPLTGETRAVFPGHKSTVADLAWNPVRGDELAAVCDGGLRIWRVGESQPVGAFDWGGASLVISWSPDGRWLVTGDQTPSVHVYEVPTRTPLHIQGFGAKAKTFAWQGSGEWLAVGSGPLISVWPCTGKKGPDGARPILLEAHQHEIAALQFLNDEGLLLSCGRDGLALLWKPHESDRPALLWRQTDGFSTASVLPGTSHLATGDESGQAAIWNLVLQKSN